MKKILFFLVIAFFNVNAFAQNVSQNKINLKGMSFIGKVDERFQSFNVEMCEVIGGDFWIPYQLIDS
ncbi:hypothetical protein, partial [Emticicia sp.]|uniref:hypothetical protein n=1 Tax=Emticicia sp. TaxID=1930953 RepID=UPI003750BFE2